MKEWPRIKIRSGAIMSKEKIENNEYLPEKVEKEREKSFSGDLFNLMARGRRKIISVELSFIY